MKRNTIYIVGALIVLVLVIVGVLIYKKKEKFGGRGGGRSGWGGWGGRGFRRGGYGGYYGGIYYPWDYYYVNTNTPCAQGCINSYNTCLASGNNPPENCANILSVCVNSC